MLRCLKLGVRVVDEIDAGKGLFEFDGAEDLVAVRVDRRGFGGCGGVSVECKGGIGLVEFLVGGFVDLGKSGRLSGDDARHLLDDGRIFLRGGKGEGIGELGGLAGEGVTIDDVHSWSLRKAQHGKDLGIEVAEIHVPSITIVCGVEDGVVHCGLGHHHHAYLEIVFSLVRLDLLMGIGVFPGVGLDL